jgi:S-adenosylmethionine decarboxylase
MEGLHLMVDLSGCTAGGAVHWPAERLRAHCLQAVREAGLQPVDTCFHSFAPAGAGVTGVVLLAESHLAVHTWPERSATTVDVYVCNFGGDNRDKAHRLLALIEAPFAAATAVRHQVARGVPPASAAAA